MEYKPYEIQFEYVSEAQTILVAPSPEAAKEGATVMLQKNGLRGVSVLSATEISTTEPTLN